jgi:hypothetical protein
MGEIQKPKMKRWKKITIISVTIFILLLALIGVLMDKYKVGIENYNKKDYESAYRLLKQIKPADKNYADASAKAAICKRVLDSLEIAEKNSEERSKQKKLAEENSKKTTDQIKNEQTAKSDKSLGRDLSSTIPGLEPSDVYLNLEKNGFTFDKQFSSENGCFWYCRSNLDGIEYDVTLYSASPSNIKEIRAQATINSASNIESSRAFFNYIASLPYDKSDHEKVSNWLAENFNRDKQQINVSGVTFSIYAPTKLYRLLTIAPQK